MRSNKAYNTARDAAKPLGFFVGEHLHVGPETSFRYYIRRLKTAPDQHNETLVKYASIEMINDYLKVAAGDYSI